MGLTDAFAPTPGVCFQSVSDGLLRKLNEQISKNVPNYIFTGMHRSRPWKRASVLIFIQSCEY